MLLAPGRGCGKLLPNRYRGRLPPALPWRRYRRQVGQRAEPRDGELQPVVCDGIDVAGYEGVECLQQVEDRVEALPHLAAGVAVEHGTPPVRPLGEVDAELALPPRPQPEPDPARRPAGAAEDHGRGHAQAATVKRAAG